MSVSVMVAAGGLAVFFLTFFGMVMGAFAGVKKPDGRQTADGPEVAPRGYAHIGIGLLFASMGVTLTAFAVAMKPDPSGNVDPIAYWIFAAGCVPLALGLYKFLEGQRKSFRFNDTEFRFRSTLGGWQTRKWTDLKAVRLRRRSSGGSIHSRQRRSQAERVARAKKRWEKAYKFLDLRFEDGKKLWVYDDSLTFKDLAQQLEDRAETHGYTYVEDGKDVMRF